MNAQEKELYWEMVRTIKLLGGKSDLKNILDIMDSSMSQGESTVETFRLLKCWNDSTDSQIDEIPENKIYKKIKETTC